MITATNLLNMLSPLGIDTLLRISGFIINICAGYMQPRPLPTAFCLLPTPPRASCSVQHPLWTFDHLKSKHRPEMLDHLLRDRLHAHRPAQEFRE